MVNKVIIHEENLRKKKTTTPKLEVVVGKH